MFSWLFGLHEWYVRGPWDPGTIHCIKCGCDMHMNYSKYKTKTCKEYKGLNSVIIKNHVEID